MFLLKILLYVSLYPWKFLPFSNHKLFLQMASFSSLKDSVASLLGEADRQKANFQFGLRANST